MISPLKIVQLYLITSIRCNIEIMENVFITNIECINEMMFARGIGNDNPF